MWKGGRGREFYNEGRQWWVQAGRKRNQGREGNGQSGNASAKFRDQVKSQRLDVGKRLAVRGSVAGVWEGDGRDGGGIVVLRCVVESMAGSCLVETFVGLD